MNKYIYDEITVGLKEEFTVEVKLEDMERFCKITGDMNPLHINRYYAKEYGFRDRVVYGMLTASYLSTLAGVYLPGEKSLIQNVEINFVKPVFLNEVLTIVGKVINKNDTFKIIKIGFSILNGQKEKVVRGKMDVGVLA